MAELQTYASHKQMVPLYHYVLTGLIVLITVGAGVNLYRSLGTVNLYSASLIFAICIALILMFIFLRTFPLKAQDRAIRAEEALRHYVLTGEPLHSGLTVRQIIGLRFASDEEFAELARRAVAEGLSEDDIKKAIRSWRADLYRV